MSDNFAKPVSGLGVPALGNLNVAASPTGGQGLALDVNGQMPVPVAGSLGGYEVASFTSSVSSGPTAVTSTGNGDALYTLPSTYYDAKKYYFEMSALVLDGGGNALYEIRLHDGTAPGPLVASAQFLTPAANPGQPATCRFSFTPTVKGLHTYQVRWRDVSTGKTYTVSNSNYPVTVRIVRA